MRTNSNYLSIPQAWQGMEQFRIRSHQEVDVNQPGCSGRLTSREAGTRSFRISGKPEQH